MIKTTAGWRLGSFEGIYQRDQMQTVDPRQPLPVDWDVIATLRPSYKFIGYTQVKRGYNVNPDLLGDDRPDLLDPFYAREQKWLRRGIDREEAVARSRHPLRDACSCSRPRAPCPPGRLVPAPSHCAVGRAVFVAREDGGPAANAGIVAGV